jgi:hypothetical protein
MATRKSNVIIFPQPVDPEREEVRIAKQFFEKIDGLVMKDLRRDLAEAEARALAGDAGAAGDVEFLCLLIRRHRDAIRLEAMAEYARVRVKARDFWGADRST